MKSFINSLVLTVLVFLFACSEGASSQNEIDDENQNEQSASVEQGSAEPTEVEPLEDPCELLSGSDLESIDGFEGSADGILHKASGDTYKQCDFLVNDKVRLGVVFKRYSEREIELKKLKSNFEFYLNQDNYTKVDNVPGDEAMYSHKTSKTPSGVGYSYTLQIRHGNHTEKYISVSYMEEEQNPAEVKEKLIQIAKIMEK